MSAIGISLFADKNVIIKDLYISDKDICFKRGSFSYTVEGLFHYLEIYKNKCNRVLMADYILPKDVLCYIEFGGKVYPVNIINS